MLRFKGSKCRLSRYTEPLLTAPKAGQTYIASSPGNEQNTLTRALQY